MAAETLADIQPAPDVLFQEVNGETVLLNLDTERYFGLDDVGTRFWQLLTQHDAATAFSRMLAEFDVDEATLRSDIATLVAELIAAGLVVPRT